MRNTKLLTFKAIGDARGWLTPLEVGNELPFEVKRVYFIYGTQPEIDRGFHAHADLEQVAVCVAGSCHFVLDDGEERKTIELNQPNTGLYLGPMIWREMTQFSSDCVLVVFANKLYDPNDYIRCHDEFVERVKQGARP